MIDVFPTELVPRKIILRLLLLLFSMTTSLSVLPWLVFSLILLLTLLLIPVDFLLRVDNCLTILKNLSEALDAERLLLFIVFCFPLEFRDSDSQRTIDILNKIPLFIVLTDRRL